MDNKGYEMENVFDKEITFQTNRSNISQNGSARHTPEKFRFTDITENENGPKISTDVNVFPEKAFFCSNGMEILIHVDHLIVIQLMEMMELVSGYETNNRYAIHNSEGRQLFLAKEDTDFFIRNCCEADRPFTINIEDSNGYEVVKLTRPYKCTCCTQFLSCSECCKDRIEVQAPIGNIIGYVKELYEDCGMHYAVQNSSNEVVLKILGPSYCRCYCPGEDIQFEIVSVQNSASIGMISKKWSNSAKEYFANANNFEIKFPVDLDVRIKAVLLASVFLIDLMFFENSPYEKC